MPKRSALAVVTPLCYFFFLAVPFSDEGLEPSELFGDSDDFDSDVIDVLRVQDTIAAEIARALQIAVEADTVLRASVKSPEVLDAYLRGLHSRGTREGTEAAVADFEKALALDPTAASYICRARVGGRYCRPVNCLPGRCPERIDSPCTLANRQMPTHFSIMSRGD